VEIGEEKADKILEVYLKNVFPRRVIFCLWVSHIVLEFVLMFAKTIYTPDPTTTSLKLNLTHSGKVLIRGRPPKVKKNQNEKRVQPENIICRACNWVISRP